MGVYYPADADPRSAYIHVPFCRHRCGYCNFALVAGRDHLVDAFLDALQVQIEALPKTYELDTLFFGGGTPSHLSAQQMHRLGNIIGLRFALSAKAEVSAECNPSDISTASLTSLAALGVNRISLGVQSFSAAKMKVLQRDHDCDIAKRAFDLCMDRFGNVSMDLIFAAPDETEKEWANDLAIAIELKPSHLSTYELTWEKGTTFWNRQNRGEFDASNEDLCANMYQHAIDCCNSSGLQQYEISSFAKTGKRCQHNLQYWLCNPWFAFGPGAASFINRVRNTNHRSTTTWIRRVLAGESTVQESEPLTKREHAIERLIFGLRMVDGIDINAFESASGKTIRSLTSDSIPSLVNRGLIAESVDRIRLTQEGIMLADTVAVELV